MSSSSRREMWVPSPTIMLHQLQSSEEEADEPAVDFHENCNRAWRAQYNHPATASVGIGYEFVNSPSRCISSSQDDDAENRMRGNSSSSTNRLVRTLEIPPIGYHPYSFGSEDENQMQHLV